MGKDLFPFSLQNRELSTGHFPVTFLIHVSFPLLARCGLLLTSQTATMKNEK